MPENKDVEVQIARDPWRRRAIAWSSGKARLVLAVTITLGTVGAVLSGFVGFWTFYKTINQEILSPVKSEPPSTAPKASRLSIAVMPFDNLSGDLSQDYFADGIVENLTTDLSVNIPNLIVIAGASAFSYKGQKIDPKQVGRELAVKYLLQGSVLRTENQVRINARIIETETGEQLWAERFDGNNTNILILQDRITARIATSLRIAFVSVMARDSHKRSSPDGLDMVLRAQAALQHERRLG